ncbi:hypothetical protein AAIR98_000010 [Elusimicrobium simillimum]
MAGVHNSARPEFSSKKPFVVNRETSFQSFLEDPKNKVFHLHGHIDDEGTILTTSEYMKFYKTDGPGRAYLSDLFSSKTILFIGFGIEEFEIMEHVHVFSRPGKRKHYALFSYLEGDPDSYLLKEYKEYYKNVLA